MAHLGCPGTRDARRKQIMSFILDALKKSESERLRKDSPGIANIAQSNRQKSSSKWMWLVLILLAINLVAVAGLIFIARTDPVTTQAPAAATESAVIEPPPAVAGNATPIERESLSPAREQPETVVAEVPAEPVVPAVDVVATAQTGTVYDGLESFNELRAKSQLVLPDLHLDIHVYSGQAADRFVFVNMSKYKEGATLTEGPAVREITTDGVILDYKGTTFLLPRE